MATPLSERLPLQAEVTTVWELIDFRFEYLASLLARYDDKEARQIRHENINIVKTFFEKLNRFLKVDQRGINNASPNLIKANIKDLYNLLSDEDKADIRRELAKEQTQLCRTNQL